MAPPTPFGGLQQHRTPGNVESHSEDKTQGERSAGEAALTGSSIVVTVQESIQFVKYVLPSHGPASGTKLAESRVAPHMDVFIPEPSVSDPTRSAPHTEEMRTIVKRGDPSAARRTVNKDLDVTFSDNMNWFQYISGTVNVDGKIVATCLGILIRRKWISQVFYDALAASTPLASQMAFELFDRYGRLKEEYCNHNVKRGSGVWQHELDRGDLLLISRLQIDEPYMSTNLPMDVLTAVVHKSRERSTAFFTVLHIEVLTMTGHSRESPSSSEEEVSTWMTGGKLAYHQRVYAWETFRLQERKKAFRSLGFRRIGSSA